MERITSNTYRQLEERVKEQENHIQYLKHCLKDIKRILQRSESQKRTLQSLLENQTALLEEKEEENNNSNFHSVNKFLPMDLALEDELQETVEILRKTQKEYEKKQLQLLQTEEKLSNSERELEDSKDCVEDCNHEMLFLQAELQCTTQKLEEIENQLEEQTKLMVDFQRHLGALKYDRWRTVLGLMSARTLVALSVQRVRDLEGRLLAYDLAALEPAVCPACRGEGSELGTGDAADVPRVPTPSLPHCRSSPRPHPSAAAAEECAETFMVDTSVSRELQSHVKWLESQLHETELDRQKERSELDEELQALEEEVSNLREERSHQALLEERLVQTLRLMRSLLEVNLSRRTIGNLVVEAVQCSVEPGTRDVSSLRFLNHLHRNTVECERISTEGLIRLALQACSEA